MTVRYQPYFCEENTWFALQDAPKGYALFITNAAGAVPIWAQRASEREDGLTMWDYHVVALVPRGKSWKIVDPDCTAGSPLELPTWVAASFPFAGVLPDDDAEPRFRVVSAADLFRDFRTDRSHMRAADGSWLAEPPPWPPLSDSSNLREHLTIDGALSLFELLDRFRGGDHG